MSHDGVVAVLWTSLGGLGLRGAFDSAMSCFSDCLLSRNGGWDSRFRGLGLGGSGVVPQGLQVSGLSPSL